MTHVRKPSACDLGTWRNIGKTAWLIVTEFEHSGQPKNLYPAKLPSGLHFPAQFLSLVYILGLAEMSGGETYSHQNPTGHSN